MWVNALTAALRQIRLQDRLYGVTRRLVAEVYYDLLGGRLDELPRPRTPAAAPRHADEA